MYDAIIAGGGLAGLSAAIRLQQQGFRVALIEKQAYPFHRVCGEYISNETLPFLQSLGCHPFELGAVPIQELQITSPKGTILRTPLDLGGFGISRYALDAHLFARCEAVGVVCHTKTQVQGIEKAGQSYRVSTDAGELMGRVVIGAFGKRSTLDSALKRDSFAQKSPYLAVKYHLQLPAALREVYPDNRITLHNFGYGYAGISRVENDLYCLCYLTTRQNLKNHKTIEALEQNVLAENPHLKQLVGKEALAVPVWEKPKVINEISFAAKPLIEKGVLMVGDAGGMIAPLCGNGMAMALHGAKLLTDLLPPYLQNTLPEADLHRLYSQTWRKQFSRRLWVGRQVQAMFGNVLMTEFFLALTRTLPPLRRWLVRNSHGSEF